MSTTIEKVTVERARDPRVYVCVCCLCLLLLLASPSFGQLSVKQPNEKRTLVKAIGLAFVLSGTLFVSSKASSQQTSVIFAYPF